tara:strand:+ start:290 stop:583 length:294 start_codon:yes stop_codon:yes gene_type:complete
MKIKSIILTAAFFSFIASASFAQAIAHKAVVNIPFNKNTMCVSDGAVYSIGMNIKTPDGVVTCVNARPGSYYMDTSYPARWIPIAYAKKQADGVSTH